MARKIFGDIGLLVQPQTARLTIAVGVDRFDVQADTEAEAFDELALEIQGVINLYQSRIDALSVALKRAGEIRSAAAQPAIPSQADATPASH